MGQFFGFLVLRSFSIATGLAAVALITWAMTASRSDALVNATLAIGLAIVFPVSLAVASGRVYPARPAPWNPSTCPHCGGALHGPCSDPAVDYPPIF